MAWRKPLTSEQLKARHEWIEALRSEKYKQARNRLRQDDCFCALGVGYDVAWPDEWTLSFPQVGAYGHKKHEHEMMAHFGLSVLEEKTIVNLNDHEGLDLYRIAEWLEHETKSRVSYEV
jgi:hypothetical protein